MLKLGDVLKQLLVCETERRVARPHHYGFHDASHPCLRKMYLDATEGPGVAHDLRSVFAATCGSAIGELVEEAAAALGAKTQVAVRLDTGKAVAAEGHADVHDADGKVVIDIKVVGESPWQRIDKAHAGMPYHVAQVNGYAAALKAKSWSLWYLRGASIFMPGQLEWRVFNGTVNRPQAEHINDRWSALKMYVDAGTIPPVPGGYTKDKFPCGWCGHKDECFPGE